MATAHTTPRTLVLLGVAALAGLGLTACAPEAAPEPSETSASASATPGTSASPSGTPETAADLDWPNVALSTQIASALLNPPGSDPEISTGQNTAGPALLEANRGVTVTADCVGTRMEYELRTAQVDEQQRVLISERVACGPESRSTYASGFDFAGPVQVAITDANGVDAAWVQVTSSRRHSRSGCR